MSQESAEEPQKKISRSSKKLSNKTETEPVRGNERQNKAMSPKLTDDHVTRLELRLKEVLNILEKGKLSVQDLKAVFGVQGELLSLKKIEFPNELRRDRDKVKEAMHRVMLRWYEKVCKYYSEKRYDRAVMLYENIFSLHFQEPEGPTDLIWALDTYKVSGETEGIFLMLAEAYLRKKVRSFFDCWHFLSPFLRYDKDREIPPPKKAFELLTEAYDAEGKTEIAILLVEKWIEVCDSKALLDRSWVELMAGLEELKLRLEEPKVIEVEWNNKELAFKIGDTTYGKAPDPTFSPQQYFTLFASYELFKEQRKPVREDEVIKRLRKLSVKEHYSKAVHKPKFGTRKIHIWNVQRKYPALKDYVKYTEKDATGHISWL